MERDRAMLIRCCTELPCYECTIAGICMHIWLVLRRQGFSG